MHKNDPSLCMVGAVSQRFMYTAGAGYCDP